MWELVVSYEGEGRAMWTHPPRGVRLGVTSCVALPRPLQLRDGRTRPRTGAASLPRRILARRSAQPGARPLSPALHGGELRRAVQALHQRAGDRALGPPDAPRLLRPLLQRGAGPAGPD